MKASVEGNANRRYERVVILDGQIVNTLVSPHILNRFNDADCPRLVLKNFVANKKLACLN